MSVKDKLLPGAFLLLCALQGQGQESTVANSPYSRFGIGDLQFKGSAQNLAMGGLSQGLASQNYINFLNPASYSALRFTSFEAAVKSNFVTYSSSRLEQSSNATSLAYLAFAFPLSKRMGASFGLIPFSNVGYKVISREVVDSVGNVVHEHNGSGGVNQVYLGLSHAIGKGLSVGINASYLFGSINRVRTVDFSDLSHPFNLRVSNTTTIGGFRFTGGLQYQKELRSNYTLVMGLSGAVASDIRATRAELTERFSRLGGIIIVPRDTLPAEPETKGSLTFPMQISGGFVLKSSKIQAGADYSLQNWSDYKEFGVSSPYLTNSSSVAAGIQYIPNADAVFNYLKIIQYRAGFRYSQTYLQLRDTKLNEIGVSGGFGLPIRKAMSVIHLGLEYGVRGTHDNNLIKEEYLQLNIGFTFNDKWFIRRKIE
jgi:hypothetical protein